MRSAEFLLPLLLVAGTSPGGVDPSDRVLPLRNGLNSVDLDKDGREDTVVVARRENYNAHGYDLATVYIWAAASQGARVELQVVPIERTQKHSSADEPEHVSARAAGGADCRLHEFRLLTRENDPSVTLVVASRPYGDNFLDRQPVAFTFFKLEKNTEAAPGRPIWSFRLSDTVVSKASYCDVNEAFKAELGVPSDGRSGEQQK